MSYDFDGRTVLELLEAARDAAKCERSEFGRLFPPFSKEGDLPYPTNENEVTSFIKERIELHHNSWIVGPIEVAIEKLSRMIGKISRKAANPEDR